MKILLISLPRTGSNSLMKRYSNQYKIDMIGEPFHHEQIEKYKTFDWKENDNFIMKSIIDQLPDNETDMLNFWYQFHLFLMKQSYYLEEI